MTLIARFQRVCAGLRAPARKYQVMFTQRKSATISNMIGITVASFSPGQAKRKKSVHRL